MNTYLTPLEVAEILKVSRITVYRWIKDGKLKAVKPGGVVRIRKEDLRKFIEGEENVNTSNLNK